MSKAKKMTATTITVLATAALGGPAAVAQPVHNGLPAGVNAGYGPAAVAQPVHNGLPAGVNAGYGPAAPAQTAAYTGPVSSGRGYGSASRAPTAGATSPTSSGGFDWGDAGIGAAGTLSVLGLGAGALALGRRIRRGQAVAN